ncbi:MAG TPA: hypothetical protein VGQ99_07115 [Tepidisphaeraceae bacterium]|nr:hypothetical protein [Tepidisphaeraceae bacterium]HEV8605118.1 hypothetical protein [Tepidisphaeraceae bacterium]
MTFPVAIYVLLYGDYPRLHRRVLESLQPYEPKRLTVWCNQVCDQTRQYLAHQPHRVHYSQENAPKYSAMRQMFAEQIEEPWVIWFDDDAHVVLGGWLEMMKRLIAGAASQDVCYIGKQCWAPMLEGQWEFIRTAAWFRGKEPYRYNGQPGFKFAQGSYWWLRTDVLRALDWPDPRLNHNGGDTMLGEAVRQLGLPLHACRYGVEVNDAPRRGYSEAPAGCINPAVRR